ncbi:hypothetical protein [Noviherbaspirillum pedocola]|uniref:Uncharacterized protein n=1 Tax=Noviherbaspirillum pedocola TaxID=2801341 RepID=A0A934T2H1_9BURK|nr:hypothetical protein [Noviherbaspirillum pedocola]MBK4737924.1 hypothetical protein [Noviherbaspirillum pedocola]
MVIWPQEVSSKDVEWRSACALMQVLALDPRRESLRGGRGWPVRRYFDSADDYLQRPMIYVDKQRVPAPYYQYSLRFNVSASVHGQIPVDDEQQLAEFRTVVNAALSGPLTVAERRQWENEEAQRTHTSQREPVEELGGEAVPTDRYSAMCFYDAVRASFETSRRSGVDHDDILNELVQLGTRRMPISASTFA